MRTAAVPVARDVRGFTFCASQGHERSSLSGPTSGHQRKNQHFSGGQLTDIDPPCVVQTECNMSLLLPAFLLLFPPSVDHHVNTLL